MTPKYEYTATYLCNESSFVAAVLFTFPIFCAQDSSDICLKYICVPPFFSPKNN